ncbi:MAG: amino acid adenylation domain-containing protein [Rhodanobacteraceae bacterium]|nr:amino acid adenylation domain-containing protein [Rhodanobacteraceae bacterium]
MTELIQGGTETHRTQGTNPASSLPLKMPLAHAQRRIWFLSGLSSQASSAYVISTGLQLRGELNPAALQHAFRAACECRDVFYLRIEEADGEPQLRFDDRASIPQLDLLDLTTADQRAIDALIDDAFFSPFDLGSGPLIRAQLLKRSQNHHVLLVNVHHVIFDGTSLQLFLRDFGAAYIDLVEGRPLRHTPARTFRDVVIHQSRDDWSERLRQQEQFWRIELQGAPLQSSLPSDRPRAAQHEFAGDFTHARIDAASTLRLRALAHRLGASLFGVLLAGWAALLQRLNARSESVVGVSTSGRTVAEYRDVIGCFVGTVPVRTAAENDSTIAEFVARTAASLRAAAAQQDLSFDRIVDAANVERNLSYNPLFQTLLNWYGATHEAISFAELAVHPLDRLIAKYSSTAAMLPQQASPLALYGGTVTNVPAKLDIALLIWESAGEITIGAEYASSLFDRPSIDRFISYWIRILEAFCVDENRVLSSVDLLTADERHRALVEWNATTVPLPSLTIIDKLSHHAQRMPSAIAVEHGNERWSYAELDVATSRVAAQLAGRGIGKGNTVAICIERGMAMLAAMLGTMRCGAAYVPVDLQLPSARRDFIINDAGVSALLCRDDIAINVVADTALVLNIDELLLLSQEYSGLPQLPHPDDIAYVIYTSGTTGLPKGVIVKHSSVMNLLLAMSEALDLREDDRVLALTTIGFDIAVLELFLPLMQAACVVVADREAAYDPGQLARVLSRSAINIMQATPTTWRMLLDSGWPGEPGLRALSGGEPLHRELALRIAERVAALWNVYGPTETTVWSTLHRVQRNAVGLDVIEAVGRPLANTRIYLLDEAGQPVPVGVTAEIYIAGEGVAHGYVGLNELTRERFLCDPFVPGQRMYRSGDLARWDESGILHHLGRNDGQIKFHGHRIELAEIETQLREHPQITDAAVALRRVGTEQHLVAYCAPCPSDEGAKTSLAATLREHLLQFLPSYMVPSIYVTLDRLPANANGKLDRHALPPPAIAERPLREIPRSGVERDVAAIWSELLDGRTIDRHDDFFRIGGHSLLAVRVVAWLRKRLGIEVGVAELFARPILVDFAAVVAQSEAPPLPAPREREPGAQIPLSFAQQRLWFIAQTSTDASRAYHMPLVLRIFGPVDKEALQQAFSSILLRHEALRTVFPLIDGEPYQQILPAAPSMPLLSEVSVDGDDEDALRAAIDAQIDIRFDLASDPPLRAALICVDEQDHVLAITVHHIACDGWSLTLFQRELQMHYSAALRHEPLPLPALPIQYADYAIWQRHHLTESQLAHHARYWKERLAGAPALFELPTDRPRAPLQDFSGDFVECAISSSTTERLRAVAEQAGTTLFVAVLASWSALLSRLSGVTDLVVGAPVANRNHEETERLIGFFANTLALRIDLSGDPTVHSLVLRCRDEVLAAQRHHELPFEQIVEALKPERSAAYTPLFQVALAWQSVAPITVALDGLVVSQQLLRSGKSAKFDVTLYLWESDDGLSGGIEYAKSLFDRTTIERYLGHWQTLLAAFVTDSSLTLNRLPLLDAAEKQRIVDESCGKRRCADPQTVHDRIEANAFLLPHTVAVCHRNDSATYAEINSRAVNLAGALIDLGICAEDRVGIHLPRSIDLIVALLAVLKTGAAYLLLDPALPEARLVQMLDDCAARALVATDKAPATLTRGGRVRIDPSAATQTEVTNRQGEVAYVIYTSGSSGRPKGIPVTHRGLGNLVDWLVDELDLAPGRLASGVCGLAFDASVIDIWPTLCAGATLVLSPVEASRDGDALLQWWSQQPFHSSMLPTPLAEIALAQGLFPATLRVLATGGARLTRHAPTQCGFRLLNLYGPAEASVVATFDTVESTGPITIGRPIPNTDAYVLDTLMQPQPAGVAGELYLGGAGISNGYFGLPELTARMFVADPFASDSGARLYRTGDRVRRLTDGRIEFLGRADDQIKLRGMRVELGEVEACLTALPTVREAFVVAAGLPASSRLVAYVSLTNNNTDEESRLNEWQRLYDENYCAPDPDVLFDFGGWNSSFTGDPIPIAEMRDWQNQTVDRIRALQPQRVLEIGCGSGLLLLALARDCARYVGVDFSNEALTNLQRKVERERIAGVELIQARADETDRFGSDLYDTIIINSVIQYFPDQLYLDHVVDAALARLAAGGRVFIGDVRNLLLAEHFHRSKSRYAAPSASVSELDRAAHESLRREKELLVAPGYFRALVEQQRVSEIQVLPKTSENRNELTTYRYDVVLHSAQPFLAHARYFDASGDPTTLARALDALADDSTLVAVIENIGNELVDGTSSDCQLRLSPAEAVAQLQSHGYCAEASWLGSDREGRFHLLIAKAAELIKCHDRLLTGRTEPPGASTNIPMQLANETRKTRELAAALGRLLPDYMVPAQFIVVPRLPLTPNGKVDRSALPLIDESVEHEFVAPSTHIETLLAEIWSDVLGCSPPGANAHFFELGGHSLAAVQVLARLRRTLTIEATLPDLFAHPVLSDFARLLERAGPADAVEPSAPISTERGSLSFEQEGLWFLSKLPGAAAAYNIVFGLRLHGHLSGSALARSLDGLLERHESLRTVFTEHDGRPKMRVLPPRACAVAIRRASHSADYATGLQDFIEDETDRHFNLESGPLFRVCVYAESDESHVLLFAMHHIVSDGWSTRVLLQDFAALYNAAAAGVAATLPPLTWQFADWALAQRQASARHTQHLASYWRAKLHGAPALLELAADRVRPTQQDFSGAFVSCRLDRTLSARVRATARRFGTTPFVVLLTSWALLLSRLSAQADIVVGTPSANRSRPEAQPLIGLLVSTLPLRLDLSGTPHLSELLKRVERCSLEAQQHQDIAFEKIVESVCETRSLAYNPIFQVMFAWQGGVTDVPLLHGATASLLHDCVPRHAKFDLSLNLADAVDGIHGGIEFASALFDVETIERYKDHWLTILSCVVNGADPTIDCIDVLSSDQRHRVLVEWNDTARDFPHDCCLHDLVRKQAQATPSAVALESGPEQLTYAQLEERADRLACHLRMAGVRSGSFVAVHISRSMPMIVAVLAILKAGGAYVPLDTTHPDARKIHVLDDCKPKWLLHAGEIPSLETLATIPLLIDVMAAMAESSLQESVVTQDSTELAYLIYTSGSTGLPKGVMLQHRSIVNRLTWMQRHFSIGPADVVLQKTALGFDVSVWEVFLPLICGARLVLAEQDSHRDPERIARVMREKRVTILHFVPSMLHLFLAQRGTLDFPHLRYVVCSGEELPPAVVEDCLRKLPGVEIQNLYGPTEASIDVSWHRCSPNHGAARVPIGRPIDNCRLYVLDAEHRLVPPGVTGELYIGGTPVARGYFNRPALNAERFLPDPFANDTREHMYKTGDQARWLPNGEIDFLGRNDAQIKLRGFRIELSEIESHLVRFPDVSEAAVALRRDVNGEAVLVAYWVAASITEGVNALMLRAHLAAVLPDYMVPALFVRMDQLPLNSNGKLDRNALPAPEAAHVATLTDTAPQGALEQRVAAAWHDVLGRQDVGRGDNFFSIGGHSLLTLRLCRRLEMDGLHVDIADIFRCPTIHSLADLLQRHEVETRSALVEIRSQGKESPLFLCHDGFGLVLYAHVLAPHLPDDVPLYGLATTVEEDEESASISLLAEHLLRVLRERQPHGPYRLAGWSFGGLLAYELATRLVDAGEQVDYLGLIDSYYRFDEPTTDERPADFAETPLHVAALEPARQQECLARHEIYALAARRYAARPLHLRVDLIKAQRCDFPAMQAYRGWERVLPLSALRVHEVDGCHFSMMTPPFITGTAAALAEGLQAAPR